MFSPDQTLLYVSDYAASSLGVPDPAGRLARAQAEVLLRAHAGRGDASSADGMAADTNGSVYIATRARRAGLRPDRQGRCRRTVSRRRTLVRPAAAAFVRREDDEPATVRRRLATYASFAEPITAFYRTRPRFASVDGLRHADEVTAALCDHIDRFRRLAPGRGEGQ